MTASEIKLFVKRYRVAAIILVALFTLQILSPPRTIDPWGLLNLHKIAQLLFALSLIQILSDLFIHFFGSRTGAIALGFFGGLVSSTALSATIAKESHQQTEDEVKAATLTYLSANLAMMVEAAFLVFYGSIGFNPRLFILFIGPATLVIILLLRDGRRTKTVRQVPKDEGRIEFLDSIKLTAFILGAIALSKLLVQFFGNEATLPLTLFISFFEIHGAVIANVQLHEASVISDARLGDLIAISFSASFAAKLFIMKTVGTKVIAKRITRITLLLWSITLLSWVVFRLV